MATPGWYPDPAGDPNAERYWDGASWHPTTRPRAGAAAGPFDAQLGLGAPGGPGGPGPGSPGGGPGGGGRGPGGSRRTGLVVGIGALVLALVAGAVVAIVLLTRGDDPGGSDRDVAGTSEPGTGGGDEDDPVPVDPKVLPPVDTADCPTYDDSVGVRNKGDGKVRGGGLAFPVPRGYHVNEDEMVAWPFPWGLDFQFAEREVDYPFYSTVSLARLPRVPGYDGTKATSALILTCIVESDLWYRHDTWEVELSEGREVAGHEAWLLTAHVQLADEGYRWSEETTYVMVVDMGPGKDYALYTASTTRTDIYDEIDRLIMGSVDALAVDE